MGYDVRQIDLLSLRRQIGMVLQTSLLFSASLRDNLTFGRPDATDEDIIAAIKAAQAYDFIQQPAQRAWIRWSVNAGSPFPAGSAKGSPSPAPC